MRFKKISIMYLPDGVRNVKAIKIPKLVIHLFFLFSLIALSLLIWASIDYVHLRELIPALIKSNDIRDEIATAVGNGADLRVIKNIYINRNLNNVPLSKIMEDVRSDIFINKPELKKILEPLDKLINEYLERNPFDALELNQKDYFENIRFKSGDNYSVIRDDIDKLALELQSKNALVNKYLSLSTKSFWISVFALCFSLSIVLIQIIKGAIKTQPIGKEELMKFRAGDIEARVDNDT